VSVRSGMAWAAAASAVLALAACHLTTHSLRRAVDAATAAATATAATTADGAVR